MNDKTKTSVGLLSVLAHISERNTCRYSNSPQLLPNNKVHEDAEINEKVTPLMKSLIPMTMPRSSGPKTNWGAGILFTHVENDPNAKLA